MEYPILIDGERAGSLTVTQQGLFTVFEAEAEDRGELLRLSVFGGGAAGYLGVMRPGDGALRLKKSLSRAAMAGFPAVIDYAGPSGGTAAPETVRTQPAPPRPAEASAPEKPAPEACDTLWFSAPDGTLSTFDGRRLLIALPAEDPRVPKGSEATVRRINGRDYVVFPR